MVGKPRWITVKVCPPTTMVAARGAPLVAEIEYDKTAFPLPELTPPLKVRNEAGLLMPQRQPVGAVTLIDELIPEAGMDADAGLME